MQVMQELLPQLPIQLTWSLFHLIFTMIVDQHHSELLKENVNAPVATSVGMEQDLHRDVAGPHNIKPLNVLATLRMSLTKARHNMMLSHIVQVMMRVNQDP